MDRHDPWVLEASCDQCLAHEARLVARAALEQLFHSDRSAQAFVDGARYFAKTTAGMLVDLLVAIRVVCLVEECLFLL